MLNRRLFDLGWLSAALLFVFSLCLAGGCSENQSAEREQSNLKPLAVFYGQYLGQHRGQPPANEQDFKKFLEAMGKDRLASMQVKSVDELFVSPRDGKPYVILYGSVSKSGAELPSTTVIAYEQAGKGGKRFIARILGAVEEIDEAKFKELVPQAK
jgi:hypothetical protein